MRIGYFLSSEEWGPRDLVELASNAERAGFDGLWISDHYHPWSDEQGHSPFVWSVIGAIAQATNQKVTTAVTCPTVRIHPAVIAQAAATASILLQGRFCLGVGSGEALNEHILGDRWPEADERLEMLEEAVQVIRMLWQVGVQNHQGRHYRVERCRVYDLPESPPPIVVSGFGPGELAQVLPTTQHFEQASELVTEEMIAEATPCGPDVDRHVKAIQEYAEAGFDELYVQQIGPGQDAFFDAYRDHVLPRFQ